MTDDKELIARLRESQSYEWQDPIWETRIAAADRMEALTEQLAAARQDAKAAEDELEMQEQEACMMENDYIKLEKERDALEAKLAKAVGALRNLHGAVCGETGFAAAVRAVSGKAYPWPRLDQADADAIATLAEIKGAINE